MEKQQQDSLNQRFRKKIKQIKQDFKALRVALEDNLVPWYVKFFIIIIVGYALSPIDLIPDFIPVLGLLDDLIIIPLLIYFTIKMIPKDTMATCRKIARTRKFSKKKSWIAGGLVLLLWVAGGVLLVHFLTG